MMSMLPQSHRAQGADDRRSGIGLKSPVSTLRALCLCGQIFFLFLLAGCNTEPPSKLPLVQMQIGKDRFTLEVADDDASRETGLMNRDSMGARHGMLFVFDEPDVLSFWMKDTRIPLDIVFLNEGGKIVSVKTMQPFDLRPVSSEKPALYAIELNAGVAREVDVKIGQTLQIPALPHRSPPASAPSATGPIGSPPTPPIAPPSSTPPPIAPPSSAPVGR